MKHRVQPPPELTTLQIAAIFAIATRAVYDTKVVSPRNIEDLQTKLEWVHAKWCRLDLDALKSARGDKFDHDIKLVMAYGSPTGYRGPRLLFAIDPPLLDGEEGRNEPASYLSKAAQHPFVQHTTGGATWWATRAVEGCIQALREVPELAHGFNNMDDYDSRVQLVGLLNDIIIEAARQGGVNQ